MTFDTLQERLDYRFKAPAGLRQALTHRSYGQPNNERLEFLGDSVVNHVIALALFSRFPDLREGDLSRLRAQLVCQDALHGIALSLELGSVLRLGEGELKSGGAERPSILSDALEAVFAAVYLDGGFDAAKAVIDRLFASHLAKLDPTTSLKDPKTRLQEWLQARRRQLPQYRLVATLGEAHAQQFEVECTVDGGLQTRGIGSSRRAAEQQAALAAMETLENHAG
ncbi:ribonuclease III [Denitromonas sp.]|uniref:ribonuclease III n=1 Tax=Denitromonas sp. TaxID=2734609 RepID=UPI003A8A95BB